MYSYSVRCLFVCVINALLMTTVGCSIFQFDRYKNFGEWYIGHPGYELTLSAGKPLRDGGPNMGFPNIHILEPRVPIYGHLRLPEIVLQPAGGIYFPRREVAETYGIGGGGVGEAGGVGVAYRFPGTVYDVGEIECNGEIVDAFDIIEAGIIDLIIPYRWWTSNASLGTKIARPAAILFPFPHALHLLNTAVWRAPVYTVHDVLKTLTIPVAAIYYACRTKIPEDGEEFELTLEPTDPAIAWKPGSQYRSTWRFVGSPVAPRTGRFKLIRLGPCNDLNDVQTKLSPFGTIPDGQWLEAFQAAFPRNDGLRAIGFASPAWVLSHELTYPGSVRTHFRALYKDEKGWRPGLSWDGVGVKKYDSELTRLTDDWKEWHWLVEIRER